MTLCRTILGGFWLYAATSMASAAADSEAARLVVVANAADADSVALAAFYVAQREIPEANVVTLDLPTTETISWDVFERDLYYPLLRWLVEHRWVEGTVEHAHSDGEWPVVAVSGHRLSYVVLCRGVPLRVAHDPARLTNAFKAANAEPSHSNAASVDAELALLAARHDLSGINGAFRNPLFDVAVPAADVLRNVVRVTRLDGPDRTACEQLVRSAKVAEEHGLMGRAYIDIGGPHPLGDEWLSAAAALLRSRGVDVVENGPGTRFGAGDVFTDAVIYLGWYSSHLDGPMLAPDFRFPPGAIALHIHSFSAETLRTREKRWVGPLVARGITATVGNVYEPYLGMTHRPDLLMRALLDGRTFGEAAYYALPVLSWQAVAVGDPLYRPFGHEVLMPEAQRPRDASR